MAGTGAPGIAPSPSLPVTKADATAPAAAAAQLAPALVQVVHAVGLRHVSVQLNPDELGHVQVHIDRAPDGSAAVQVVVERPETLKLLIQDQAQLHRALDDAGLPQDGRSLNLSLGSPSGGNPDAGTGPPSQGFGGQPDRRPGRTPAQTAALAHAAWQRAGIDITA